MLRERFSIESALAILGHPNPMTDRSHDPLPAHLRTQRRARRLGLYTIVVTIVLVLSGSFSQARPVLPQAGWGERLAQAVPTLLLSDPHPLSHPARRS